MNTAIDGLIDECKKRLRGKQTVKDYLLNGKDVPSDGFIDEREFDRYLERKGILLWDWEVKSLIDNFYDSKSWKVSLWEMAETAMKDIW